MAVRMRKVLARPWVGVRVCHLLLLVFYFDNVMTKFIFNNRTDALKTGVNLILMITNYPASLVYASHNS